jgi:hypothetical protein
VYSDDIVVEKSSAPYWKIRKCMNEKFRPMKYIFPCLEGIE